jgi:hypothetical protein
MAHIHLVLEDQFQELAMAQAARRGLLEANVEGLGQARESELTEGGLELSHGVGMG